MESNLIHALKQIEKEKEIKFDILIEAVESALVSTYRKSYRDTPNVVIKMDRDNGNIRAYLKKTVVENVVNPQTESSLEEAKNANPETQLGENVDMEIPLMDFGRIAAQAAKQVIFQKIKEAERDKIFDLFKDKEYEITSGTIQKIDYNAMYVDLGKAEAVLPYNEQIKRENYRPGQRIKACIIEVRKTSTDPQIILSRTHPKFLEALFKQEVPEIGDGIVEVRGIARDPGSRSKIAVYSSNPSIDCIGSCVGMKGVRVQFIVRELGGEKIDIVQWNENISTYVKNAFRPIKINNITVNEEGKSVEIIVPDDQLSLSIGKSGQNIKLISKLINWRIDVTSESRKAEERQRLKPEKGQEK